MSWPWSEVREEMTALRVAVSQVSAIQQEEVLPRLCKGLEEGRAWGEKTDLRLSLIEQAVNRALHELTRLRETRR